MPILGTITLRDVSDWRRLAELVREHAGPRAAEHAVQHVRAGAAPGARTARPQHAPEARDA